MVSLAVFIGYEVITKVPPTLHTPLMSGSNAISGIAIVGALLAISTDGEISTYLGLAALICATINVVGGTGITVNADDIEITVADVRGLFSASGDISYNSGTGAFSFTNDAGIY